MKWCPILLVLIVACSRSEPAVHPVSTPPTSHAVAAPIETKEAAPVAKPSIKGFKPSLHGFAFRNDFQGSPLPFGLGNPGNLPNRFGLCGGMSFAAADYYIAKRDPPTETKPPVEGTPLYKYLFMRQGTSIGPLGAMGLKFMEWMRTPDGGPDGTRARTLKELPSIIAAIERNEPVIIGLVLVSIADTPEPWNNHQVLACGVDASELRTDIHIYDPNFPKRDDVTIRITRDGDDCSIALVVPGRRDSRIRGFFRMSYAPVIPPN